MLIVEVLSPSTDEHDRSVELAHYRRLASVQEVLLVQTNERRAEVYRRLEGGQWLITGVESGTIELSSVRSALTFDDVCTKVASVPLDPEPG